MIWNITLARFVSLQVSSRFIWVISPLFLFFSIFRLESAFRSFSRPVLHAASRVVQEMGRSRAAAISVGLQDIDERDYVNTFSDALDDPDVNESSHPEGKAVLYC